MKLATPLVLALFAGACTQALPTRADRDGVGYMRGDLDTVTSIDDRLYDAYGYFDGYSSHLEVHALGDYGWAMVGVDLYGAEFGSGPLAPGETLTIYSDGTTSAEEEEVGGSGIGCSGPDYGDFAYDEPSQEIGLSVDTDPVTGELIIDIIADFGDAGVVEASVPMNGVSVY